MLKVDQLEYLHCNSVVMWPEYHKIQKPIKINWMEGVREKSTSSASRYVCARRVWNAWCWSDMTNHSNTHNPTIFILLLVLCANVTPWRLWCDFWLGVMCEGCGSAQCRGGWVSAHRKAELSYHQQCECDITIMRDNELANTRLRVWTIAWRNVKHGALPLTASNRSSHITVTLWTLPRRSSDQDIWIWGDGMEEIIFLDLLTTLPRVQTW